MIRPVAFGEWSNMVAFDEPTPVLAVRSTEFEIEYPPSEHPPSHVEIAVR